MEFLNDQNMADDPDLAEDLGGLYGDAYMYACKGTRLKPESLAVRVCGKSISEIVSGRSRKQFITLRISTSGRESDSLPTGSCVRFGIVSSSSRLWG